MVLSFLQPCFGRRTSLLEKCVSSLIKNENKYYRLGQNRQYLDRGDSKIAEKVSKICGTISYTIFSSNEDTSTAVRNRRQSKPLVPSKKDTARLSSSEGTFRVHQIYGDGNCMFRAISYILLQNEDEHRHLRSLVVQHIKENWNEYEPFVMAEWNISDRQKYCDFMNMVGTFASELECTVATKIYYMNLSIYRRVNNRDELKRVFHNHVSSQYDTARLLFTGISDSGHYDVLLPDT